MKTEEIIFSLLMHRHFELYLSVLWSQLLTGHLEMLMILIVYCTFLTNTTAFLAHKSLLSKKVS